MIRFLKALFSASTPHPAEPDAVSEPLPERITLVDLAELRRDVDLLMRAEKSRQGRERAASRWSAETPQVDENGPQRANAGHGGLLKRRGA